MNTDFFDLELDVKELKGHLQNKDNPFSVSIFQYSKVLIDIMERDIFVCGPDSSIGEASREMTKRKVSSVIVIDKEEKPVGIVTERDMVSNVIAKNLCDFDGLNITSIMTKDPICLTKNDNLFDALSIFSKHGIKHLPILDNDKISGIITFRNIVRICHFEPLILISELYRAEKIEDYKLIKDNIIHMVDDQLNANVDPIEIITMISTINLSIHKYLLNKVFKEFKKVPPVKFSFFVTGSLGRGENLLFPDQDFGIIIEDYDDNYYNEYDSYFRDVALKYSEFLDQVGFAYCKGNIMGSNPTWRKRLSEWKVHINYVLEGVSSQSTRYATLLFDAVHFYGDRDLFNEINEYTHTKILKHHNLLREMHTVEGSFHRVPLTFFKNFITEKDDPNHMGEINMKRSGLIFIIEATRILALKLGLKETSTMGRLQALVERGTINRDESEFFENAYKVILQHTLQSQVDNYKKDGSSDYYLNPNSLSPRKRRVLKSAFEVISQLQDIVAAEFGEMFT